MPILLRLCNGSILWLRRNYSSTSRIFLRSTMRSIRCAKKNKIQNTRRETQSAFKFFIILIFLFIFNLSAAMAQADERLPLETIRLPKGFKIAVYAEHILNARSMALSPKGILFVGTHKAGNVYALVDQNHDGRADEGFLIAKGLNSPNGVAFADGSLYVAEINRVLRFDDIENHLDHPPRPVVINEQLPADEWHGWKFIRFGPDGLLYVPVGAPCNVCEREDVRYASILRMKQDGSHLQLFSRGIRNTVGFDWDPETKELWFTDNGRDRLGDDIPSDELNHAPQIGMHFGFPYCHAKNISDPEFGAKHACAEFTPAALELVAHVAALGMRFYTGAMFPSEYNNQIFIAQHGSWDRSQPIGYRVMTVQLKDHQPVDYKIFAEGWLKSDGKPWGRPVDVQVMPDGALLVSDDFANAIYRITYEGQK